MTPSPVVSGPSGAAVNVAIARVQVLLVNNNPEPLVAELIPGQLLSQEDVFAGDPDNDYVLPNRLDSTQLRFRLGGQDIGTIVSAQPVTQVDI